MYIRVVFVYAVTAGYRITYDLQLKRLIGNRGYLTLALDRTYPECGHSALRKLDKLYFGFHLFGSGYDRYFLCDAVEKTFYRADTVDVHRVPYPVIVVARYFRSGIPDEPDNELSAFESAFKPASGQRTPVCSVLVVCSSAGELYILFVYFILFHSRSLFLRSSVRVSFPCGS